jgi:hypothetical protein
MFRDRALFVVLPNDRDTDGFDAIIRFRDARAELEERERREADEAPSSGWADAGVEKRVAGAVT